MDNFGFILLRHVNSVQTNRYWNRAVKCIHAYYPLKQIVIIDDNSNSAYLQYTHNCINARITVIKSEFHGRGEILPYYYFLKTKFFQNAIIIHDSVFFHKRINFEILVNNNTQVKPLWFFYPDKENIDRSMQLTQTLTNSHGIQQKINMISSVLAMPDQKWYGCFGCQCFINHNFLLKIEKIYNISKLVNVVKTRADRCCLERILGCIMFTNYINSTNKSIFGNIMKYQTWGYTYDKYISDTSNNKFVAQVIKVWTGR